MDVEGRDYLLCNICLGLTGDSRKYCQIGQHLRRHRIKVGDDNWKQLFAGYPSSRVINSEKHSESSRKFYKSEKGLAYRERLRQNMLDNNLMYGKFKDRYKKGMASKERITKISEYVLEQYRNGNKKPPDGFVYKNTKTGHFKSVKNNCSIFYRSSLELKAYEYLENNSDVVSFSEKPPRIILPSGHTYFPDILVEYKNGNKILVEVKPFNWLLLVGAHRNRLVDGCILFIEKLDTAEQFCAQKGWKFQVWTDRDF